MLVTCSQLELQRVYIKITKLPVCKFVHESTLLYLLSFLEYNQFNHFWLLKISLQKIYVKFVAIFAAHSFT